MKAKCINAIGYRDTVTEGKIYDVKYVYDNHFVRFTGDNGFTVEASAQRFEEVKDINTFIKKGTKFKLTKECIGNNERGITPDKIYTVKSVGDIFTFLDDDGDLRKWPIHYFLNNKANIVTNMKLNIVNAEDARVQSDRNNTENLKIEVENGINKAIIEGHKSYSSNRKFPEEIVNTLNEMGYRVIEFTTKTQIAWS